MALAMRMARAARLSCGRPWAAVRELHQGVSLLRSKHKYPPSKEVKVALPPAEWVPPQFPEEVQAAGPLTDAEGKKWNVFVAACLARYPRITPDKTKEELEYAAFRKKIDLEKSCLSIDEIKEEEARKRKAKNPEEDDESKFEQYREEFIPADRVTEEDRKNDRRSLNRHLQHSLFLLTKGAAGWALPTVALGSNDTLRSAVDRCVVRTVGTDMFTYTVGNCPSGCLVVPPSGDKPGSKVQQPFVLCAHRGQTFFLRVVYVDGPLSLHKDFKDHVWVPNFEMGEYVNPAYLKVISPFAA